MGAAELESISKGWTYSAPDTARQIRAALLCALRWRGRGPKDRILVMPPLIERNGLAARRCNGTLAGKRAGGGRMAEAARVSPAHLASGYRMIGRTG